MSGLNYTGAILAAAMMAVAAGCASAPKNRIEAQLLKAGFDDNTAQCFAYELNEKLDREALRDVSKFLTGLERSDTPGQAVDTLLSIDNPRAAAGVARAGLACALDKLSQR